MNENNNVNIDDVNSGEEALIKTQEELTNLLRAVKNGEQIDEKYKICMKEESTKPCVDLFRCLKNGFIAKGVIKNVDDIFQYLVFDFGPDHQWSHDNFTDQHQIAEVLSLVCQPGYNVNRIKSLGLRLVAAAFDVNAIRHTDTKYIFNLKEQMNLGIVKSGNYSAEDHIEDFLLPDSIEDIGDLVKFMGYDSENNKNQVLPEIDYWDLIWTSSKRRNPYTGKTMEDGFARQCLKNHRFDTSNELMRKFEESKRAGSSADEQKKLYLDLRSELEKARDNSGAIKNFDQFKKIVNFPNDQPKLPFTHTMFFANNSVRDGVEFLKLFDDKDKVHLLTDQNDFRVFKPGAFSFETRSDTEEFLKTECSFIKYGLGCRLGLCTGAILLDLLMLVVLLIHLVVLVGLYIPLQIFSNNVSVEPLPREYSFFEWTRKACEINAEFELAIKNIENNYAAGKQPNNLNSEVKSENNQREIPDLEQVPLTVSINNN